MTEQPQDLDAPSEVVTSGAELPPPAGFVESPDAALPELRQRLEVQRLRSQIAYHDALAEQLRAQTGYLTAERELREQDKGARGVFLRIVAVAAVVQLLVANLVFTSTPRHEAGMSR